jgi:hypothetical protein
MGDDKSRRGELERARVSAEEPYEVDDFAIKHRLSEQQARNIIRRSGGSRKQADEIAIRERRTRRQSAGPTHPQPAGEH